MQVTVNEQKRVVYVHTPHASSYYSQQWLLSPTCFKHISLMCMQKEQYSQLNAMGMHSWLQ